MKREIEEYRKTPVQYECDVVVCGGGTAGFTAALASARNGRGYHTGGTVWPCGGNSCKWSRPAAQLFNLYKAFAGRKRLR